VLDSNPARFILDRHFYTFAKDRELLIGHSSLGRLLIVSYTLRGYAIR
jgi:uncharacterized DUF497 family protein